jgi:hypothetical protein
MVKIQLLEQQKNISLDISTVITEVSKLYGGGASKDPEIYLLVVDQAISTLQKL